MQDTKDQLRNPGVGNCLLSCLKAEEVRHDSKSDL
jgi:hypothetical protein